MKKNFKSAKAYDKMKAAREAAAVVAKARTSVRTLAAIKRETAKPQIGGDLNNDVTDQRLIKASEKFLHLLHAEAIASIRNVPHEVQRR
jgi:hypothetical protein